MGQRVRDYQLNNRASRLRLSPRHEPYWRLEAEGQHIGYYRGLRTGKWVARYREQGEAGGYRKTTLGDADDRLEADGNKILTWADAKAAASAWFASMKKSGRRTGRYTVADALDDYLEGFRGRSVSKTKARVESAIRPELGHLEVSALTTERLRDWHRRRSEAPARLRTSKTATIPNVRETVSLAAARSRRSTANRDLTVLKAALNRAMEEGKVARDDEWRRVKPFRDADGAKTRHLTDEEARRLCNACSPVFRPVVQAALLTGARYGELTGLKVADVDLRAGLIWLRETKSGVPRAVYLEAEGQQLMAHQVAGKVGAELVFKRPDGHQWGASQQARFMAGASRDGAVEPAVTFHDLRRTYGARLAVRGVPLAVIAEALGHADERITRRHYAHLSPGYVSSTVRQHAAGMGIVEKTNVVAMAAGQGTSEAELPTK